MGKAIGWIRFGCAVSALVLVIAGCSPRATTDVVSTTKSALTTSNGLNQNGLSTNGLIENGFWTNGFWTNGFWTNGFWTNGFWTNGFWTNGFWTNGFWTNGISGNGFWTNGFWTNGFWTNGFDGTPNAAGQVLLSNPYGRELLQYIYSCAMPADGYDTTLDPNLASPILCTPDGVGADGGTGCDLGYDCIGGKCVIPLHGGGANGSGLAINADGSTWWGSGKCDETCQRWISACVLARTNAYGVHVKISMRAPASAPQAIRDALAVTLAEGSPCPPGSEQDQTCGYTHREGAYYGNLFATTPINPPPPGGAADAGTDGGTDGGVPAVGPIADTPQFYACAGPDSNTPEITQRFCSSQGDQSVIHVPGICVTTDKESGMCEGMDPTGSIFGCNTTRVSTKPNTHYDEVVSVYLKDALSTCGNGVCENGETTPGGPAYCPSDCHPDTWAATFGMDVFDSVGGIGETGPTRKVAIDSQGSVVVADIVCDAPTIDLDPADDPTQPQHLLAGTTDANLVLISYDANGKYLWGLSTVLASFSGLGCTYARGLAAVRVDSVDVANDGSITVVGFTYFEPTGESVDTWIARFSSGSPPMLASGWPVTIGEPQGYSAIPADVDSAGNVAVAGLGPLVVSGVSVGSDTTINIAKMWSDGNNHAGGPFAWAVNEPAGTVTGVAFDSNGNVVTVLTPSAVGSSLYKLAGSNGHQIGAINYATLPASDPTSGTQPEAVATDSDGNIYVAGSNCQNGAQQCGTILIKYASDDALTYLWNTHPVSVANSASGSSGQYLALDGSGSVLVAGFANNTDFGAGLFQTYTYPNVFISAYSTADTLASGQSRFVWAKQIPMILDSGLSGFGVGGGHVALAGAYSGSMQLDDLLLVNAIPELTNNHNAFVGSFVEPAPDTTAPMIGLATDPTGVTFSTLPQNIYAQATGPLGTTVFYVPPTAIDAGNAGTNVVCSPPPFTMFPFPTPTPVTFPATTTVACTAYDPIGNSASASFTVTVVDTSPPVFSSVTALLAVQATSASGAPVPYAPPTAVDRVDGPVQVTCVPSMGSTFPVGTTTVTCTASDKSGNQSAVTFTATVAPPTFGGPCATSADCVGGACIDGVCCNTTGTTCGQCQACNVPGSLGACTATTGGSCSDGNACTETDTCQAGVCVGTNPVTCQASDQCHAAGTCDPATGACSNPAAPYGTTCNDGNACTQTDICQAGACVGTNPITCSASDQCHIAGMCNPASGTCSSPAAPNGTTCSDGNACTRSDSCQAGVCIGASPVICTVSDQCHLAGVCSPSTGLCSNPAAPDGTTCSDGNACTNSDTCGGGICASGPALSCDDHNPCTVDSCNPASGCASTPGNAGAVCRGAANACDSAETCTGTSATCPANTDKLAPVLSPGIAQTIVGSCSSTPVSFTLPPLANATCESGTTITCTSKTTPCTAKDAKTNTLPGNSYGAHSITCTAKDASGNVSAPVTFTVAVLEPLTVRIQPPLSGDNDAVDNIVKDGSTVPTKVQLYACGANVTTTASVVTHLGVSEVASGGASTSTTVSGTTTGSGDAGGVMTLNGASYQYNLSTKGFSLTAGVAAFYQETISVAYKSAPTVTVGTDLIQIDTK